MVVPHAVSEWHATQVLWQTEGQTDRQLREKQCLPLKWGWGGRDIITYNHYNGFCLFDISSTALCLRWGVRRGSTTLHSQAIDVFYPPQPTGGTKMARIWKTLVSCMAIYHKPRTTREHVGSITGSATRGLGLIHDFIADEASKGLLHQQRVCHTSTVDQCALR